jgi:hypothetical protein
MTAVTVQKGSVIDTQITNDWVKFNYLPAGVRFCHWAAPETTGTSEKIFQAVLAYVSYAIIIVNTIQSIRIANLRYEIAKGYANLARDRWNRFSARFKPLERYLIDLLLNDPEITVDYEEARGIARECAADPGWEVRWRRTALRYGLCPDRSLGRGIRLLEGIRTDDLVNLGYRDAEFVAELRSVERWNRRLQVLNTGRDLSTISTAAARAGDEILEKGMEAAGQGISSAIGFLSYMREANDRAYSHLGVMMPVSSAPVTTGG